ncbi:MAG: hypothetical protein ACRDLB_08615 [Actinomycetota bacterium]
MSLLLIGLPHTLAVTLVRRLVAEQDEVRVLLSDGSDPAPWKRLGAYVATGDHADADLIERAATEARTLVLGDDIAGATEEEREAILTGARRASVGRIVVCQSHPRSDLVGALRGAGFEFVVLATAKKALVGRPKTKIPISKLSEAIDAADDITEPIQAELDLTIPKAWKVLKVSPPVEK